MLKSREQLAGYLKDRCYNIILDHAKCTNIAKMVNDLHGIPTGQVMDLISEREDLFAASEFALFCLVETIDKIDGTSITKSYFTDKELLDYSNAKYEKINEIKFPIVVDCIQVSSDQWIGAIDVKFIMQLRMAQLIHYNINAQRTMKRVINGNKTEYIITVNKNAVKEISNSLSSREYIPNTITLNIPYELDSDFYYDDKKKQLIINDLPRFDMSDGYHRYRAMCSVSDNDVLFNYPMELRITNFAETKVRQFIFQEDQKTKMSKIDSDSMNMNNAANITLENLNADPGFIFKGLVGRNNGLIPFAEFAKVVNYYYFTKIPKKKERLQIINTQKEIKQIFNELVSYDISYLEKEYSPIEILSIMVIFKEYPDLSIEQKISALERVKSNLTKEDTKKLNMRTVTGRHINLIKHLAEVDYVQ